MSEAVEYGGVLPARPGALEGLQPPVGGFSRRAEIEAAGDAEKGTRHPGEGAGPQSQPARPLAADDQPAPEAGGQRRGRLRRQSGATDHQGQIGPERVAGHPHPGRVDPFAHSGGKARILRLHQALKEADIGETASPEDRAFHHLGQ